MTAKKHEQWIVDDERLRELKIMHQQPATPRPPRPQARGEHRRVTNTEIPVPTLDLPITAMALVRDVSKGGVQITTRSALEIGDAISFKLVGERGQEHILTGTVRHVSWNGGSGECTAGLGWDTPSPLALEAWRTFLGANAEPHRTRTEDWVVLTGHKTETD